MSLYLINPSISWAWDSQAAEATRSTAYFVIQFPAATTSWVLQARRFQDKVFSPFQDTRQLCWHGNMV